MADIFISYNAEDRERVRPLVDALEANGWSVWWDREIRPGRSFQREIAKAIDQAACVVVCWTRDSIDSDWVAGEADEGKSRGVLVPVLLDEVKPPLGFRMDHAADLIGWRAGQSHPELDALIAAVAAHTGAPHTTAANVTRAASVDRRRGWRWGAAGLGLAVAASVWVWLARDSATTADAYQTSVGELLSRPSVVVLPFESAGLSQAREHVPLGLMYELIVSLREMRAFPVASANSSLMFVGSELPVTTVAAELDASYVVQGNVTEAGPGLKVVAMLSDAKGRQVWTERFERQTAAGDLLDVVDELAVHIAAAVRDSEISRVHRSERPPADAWDHYIHALDGLINWRPERYEAAVEHARQAIAIAPTMAEAWWALGELQVFNYMERYHEPGFASAELEPIIANFRRAHDLSPFHASACGCLGFLLTAVGREDEAKAVYEMAVEVNPLAADLLVDFAPHLLWTGNYDGAREVAQLALRLDPVSEDRANGWMYLAVAQFVNGEREAALRSLHRGLFIQRNYWGSPVAIPLLYLLGDVPAARRELAIQTAEMPALDPRNPLTYMALKSLDDLLQRRRSQGAEGLPDNVLDIFTELGWAPPVTDR